MAVHGSSVARKGPGPAFSHRLQDGGSDSEALRAPGAAHGPETTASGQGVVVRASLFAHQVPPRVRGPEALLSAPCRETEHAQLLALLTALGPRLVDNVQQGVNSFCVGHDAAVSTIRALRTPSLSFLSASGLGSRQAFKRCSAMGKYDPLLDHLKHQKSDEFEPSFVQIGRSLRAMSPNGASRAQGAIVIDPDASHVRREAWRADGFDAILIAGQDWVSSRRGA